MRQFSQIIIYSGFNLQPFIGIAVVAGLSHQSIRLQPVLVNGRSRQAASGRQIVADGSDPPAQLK